MAIKKIRLYNPTYQVRAKPSAFFQSNLISDLKGKRVGILDNAWWIWEQTLPALTEALTQRYGAARTIVYKVPRSSPVSPHDLGKIAKQVDCVIIGLAHGYPEIQFEDVIVDNMSQQLVMRPQQYDVIVAPNLYGDILSDLCAGLVGGLGIAPGADIGDEYAVFEAVHGSAPDIAGQDKANPMALMLTSAMMLKYLGEKEAGERIESAIASILAEGKYVTADLLPPVKKKNAIGTQAVADAVIRAMAATPC